VRVNYWRPGGFLYVYFVAGVMRLFGRNSAYVYLVQSALLGLSVVLHLGLARKLSAPARLAYLALVVVFLYLDVFRHYTNRLLSENLILVLLPLALAGLIRANERPSAGRGLLAGLALGAAILTRPNLLPLGLAAAVLLAAYPGRRRHAMRTAGALLGGIGIMVGLMVLRNFLVTGVPGAAIFTDTSHWIHPTAPEGAGLLERSWAAVEHYGSRVLFMLGWLPILEPTYRVRPHWLAAWAGVGVFAVTTWRRPVAFWEAVLVVTLVVYLVPQVAVSHLANYGFRSTFPVIPLALLLAVRGVERWWHEHPDGHAAKVPVTERP
jgi:4-amino-4-deoxy-L-arabinose transferase-like glycosyltransferase